MRFTPPVTTDGDTGYTAMLVAAILAVSRSSLCYRKKPRGSRAERTYHEQIVVACGKELAYATGECRVEAIEPNQIWQLDRGKSRPAQWWAGHIW